MNLPFWGRARHQYLKILSVGASYDHLRPWSDWIVIGWYCRCRRSWLFGRRVPLRPLEGMSHPRHAWRIVYPISRHTRSALTAPL